MRRPYIVVGDAFTRFARHDSVVTASELCRRLALHDGDAAPARVLLGQGLSSADRKLIAHLMGDEFVREPEPRAEIHLTHKREAGHVLITRLLPVGEHKYECELDLDDLSDRLSDHVTGQHLGGMLLLEAARQACIVALEREYGVDGPMKWGMAWSDLSARFFGYAYPLPTKLVVTIVETNNGEASKLSVRVPIEVSQAGKRVCEFELAIALIERRLLESVEDRRAKQAIEAVTRSEDGETQIARPA